jgi:hypothetical protein
MDKSSQSSDVADSSTLLTSQPGAAKATEDSLAETQHGRGGIEAYIPSGSHQTTLSHTSHIASRTSPSPPPPSTSGVSRNTIGKSLLISDLAPDSIQSPSFVAGSTSAESTQRRITVEERGGPSGEGTQRPNDNSRSDQSPQRPSDDLQLAAGSQRPSKGSLTNQGSQGSSDNSQSSNAGSQRVNNVWQPTKVDPQPAADSERLDSKGSYQRQSKDPQRAGDASLLTDKRSDDGQQQRAESVDGQAQPASSRTKRADEGQQKQRFSGSLKKTEESPQPMSSSSLPADGTQRRTSKDKQRTKDDGPSLGTEQQPEEPSISGNVHHIDGALKRSNTQPKRANNTSPPLSNRNQDLPDESSRNGTLPDEIRRLDEGAQPPSVPGSGDKPQLTRQNQPSNTENQPRNGKNSSRTEGINGVVDSSNIKQSHDRFEGRFHDNIGRGASSSNDTSNKADENVSSKKESRDEDAYSQSAVKGLNEQTPIGKPSAPIVPLLSSRSTRLTSDRSPPSSDQVNSTRIGESLQQSHPGQSVSDKSAYLMNFVTEPSFQSQATFKNTGYDANRRNEV